MQNWSTLFLVIYFIICCGYKPISKLAAHRLFVSCLKWKARLIILDYGVYNIMLNISALFLSNIGIMVLWISHSRTTMLPLSCLCLGGGDISVIRVTGANLIIVVGDTDIYLVISQLGLHFEQNSEPNRWNHGPPKAPRQLTPSWKSSGLRNFTFEIVK